MFVTVLTVNRLVSPTVCVDVTKASTVEFVYKFFLFLDQHFLTVWV